jgi:integrase
MRGDGTLYKRGNVWWVRYFKNGKSYSQSSKSSDERVARRLLRQKLGEIRAGTFIGPVQERLVFEDLVASLRADYKLKGNRSGRIAEMALRRLGESFAGDRVLAITTDRITSYAALRLDEGLSASTIRYDLAILRRSLNLMKQASKLSSVPHVPMLAPAEPRQGFLDPATFTRLHDALPDHLKDPVNFLYLTGWRVGEMRSLEWRDVSLADRTIRLRAANAKNKTGRTIKLAGELLDILNRAHAARRLDCAAVFHVDGRPLGSFRKSWRSACQTAGLGEVLLVHDLRRSAIRNMVRAGVPETIAMRLSGHKTRSVFQRYDITSEEDLADAAERIDLYVGERRKENAKVVPIKAQA